MSFMIATDAGPVYEILLKARIFLPTSPQRTEGMRACEFFLHASLDMVESAALGSTAPYVSHAPRTHSPATSRSSTASTTSLSLPT